MTNSSVIGAAETPSMAEDAPMEALSHTFPEAQRDPELCPLAGFFAQGGATEVAGVSLVHMAGQDFAKAGELITFTAWILNATSEVLLDASLYLRSFTNEQGDQLDYRTKPHVAELTGRTLGPRQALKFDFSYEVTDRDVEEPGLLISALRADLVSPSRGTVFSECDALVPVAPPSATQTSHER